jgi:hypothetical protein
MTPPPFFFHSCRKAKIKKLAEQKRLKKDAEKRQKEAEKALLKQEKELMKARRAQFHKNATKPTA